ncbi:MAG TPA: HU family DNA-binding protein [Ktedonobacteraceae bacterium]|nr:HU family DNA-binding protein [Ktedonobacteraceae bacterium]
MTTVSPEKSPTIVGKDELIHQVAAKAGMNLKETSKVIDAFTEVVREDIAEGHEVRLMGFGTWNLRNVAPRKVKSIRGGKQITIPARKRVGFSVGAVLSQAAQSAPTTGMKKTTSTPSTTYKSSTEKGTKKY